MASQMNRALIGRIVIPRGVAEKTDVKIETWNALDGALVVEAYSTEKEKNDDHSTRPGR